MQEVFEKIIEKLEGLRGRYGDEDFGIKGILLKIIEIVKKEAEEYNNGWIPCSERLPKEQEEGLTDIDECDEYIAMIKDADIPTALNYAGNGEWYRDGNYYNVVAWQPLPEPYKQKGE